MKREKINFKYIAFMLAVTFVTVVSVYGIPVSDANPAVSLTEIHTEITDIEDMMQIILENWDAHPEETNLKDMKTEVNRLMKANYKLGKLIDKK